MTSDYAGAGDAGVSLDPAEIRLAALYDYCHSLGSLGEITVYGSGEMAPIRAGNRPAEIGNNRQGFHPGYPEFKFHRLNSDIPTRGAAKRSWLSRLWRRDRPMEYDSTVHEVRAAAVELSENTTKLYEAAEPYLNAENPLIALTIALLNEQQMRFQNDDESHSGDR